MGRGNKRRPPAPPKEPTRKQPERANKRTLPFEREDFGDAPKGTRKTSRWETTVFDVSRQVRKRASASKELAVVRRGLMRMAADMREGGTAVETVPPSTFSFGPVGGTGAGFYRVDDCRIFRYHDGVYVWVAVQELTAEDAPKSGKRRDGECYLTLVKLVNGYVVPNESSRICNKILALYCVNGPMIVAYALLEGLQQPHRAGQDPQYRKPKETQ